jgi:hypothetical protein
MKRYPALLVGMFLMIPLLAYAQTPTEFDELRANRTNYKLYLQAVITRQLAVDVAEAMTRNGFKEEQIKEVLRGDGFRTFSKNVLTDKKVEQALEFFLDRILAPGALEASVEALRQENLTRQRNAYLMTVEEMLRNQKKRTLESRVMSEKPFWDRIWDRLRKELFS